MGRSTQYTCYDLFWIDVKQTKKQPVYLRSCDGVRLCVFVWHSGFCQVCKQTYSGFSVVAETIVSTKSMISVLKSNNPVLKSLKNKKNDFVLIYFRFRSQKQCLLSRKKNQATQYISKSLKWHFPLTTKVVFVERGSQFVLVFQVECIDKLKQTF